MKRLLSIEWSKLYNYKAARIFILLYFVALIAFGVIASFIKPNVGGMEINLKELGFFDFPYIWQNITFLFAIGKLFLGMIIIMNMTNEYSNGTLKQNLIDGLSKEEFIRSKWLTNIVLALASALFVFIITSILGLIFSGSTFSFYDGMAFLFAYFIKLLFFFTLCLFLAVLLKKSVLALLGFFVLWMVEGSLMIAELLTKGTTDKELNEQPIFITDYLPLGSSGKLIPYPSVDLQGFLMNKSAFVMQYVNWSFVLTSVCYTLLFMFLTSFLLKRRDL